MSGTSVTNPCRICGGDLQFHTRSCEMEIGQAQPTGAYTRGWNDALEEVAKCLELESAAAAHVKASAAASLARSYAAHVRSLKKP